MLRDTRGYSTEAFEQAKLKRHIRKVQFVQDNESRSSKGVLRGLYYQLTPYSRSKLARVIKGRVLDVAVDVREGSPTFGKYIAVELSNENKRQLFTPQGFARGFHVLNGEAIFTYKVDNSCTPTHGRGIRYGDPTAHVDWSITSPESINLSGKDAKAPLLKDAELNFKY